MHKDTRQPKQLTWNHMADEEVKIKQFKSIFISRKTAQRAGLEKGG